MAGSRSRAARVRRRRWSFSLGRTLLILPLMTLGQAYGHDPGRGPPSDTGPPIPERTNVPPVLPADDNWHHNLVRERPVEVRLRTAQKELQAGRLTEALLLLQAVLDSDDDVFVRLESQPVPSGARHLADRLLGSLPPDALQTYEAMQGSAARRLLERPGSEWDPRHLTEINRRFFHTAAGAEATTRLSYHWLDHGNVELAAVCWQRLLADPIHRQRLGPEQLTAAAGCLRRAGRPELARQVEGLLANATPRIAGNAVPPLSSIERLATDPEGDLRPRASMVGGDANRNGVVPGSIAAASHPAWRISLAGNNSAHVAALAHSWEMHQRQNGMPIGAAHAPLVVGERLIVRDFEGIRAVALRDGTTLWFYATNSSLSRDIPPRQGIPAEGNPDPNDLMGRLVGNSVMGTLAADGRNVFAIDRSDSGPPARQAADRGANDAPVPTVAQGNLLIALPIDPLARDPATAIVPVWTAGGPLQPRDAAAPAALAGHHFIGPPLPLADRLYAVSEFRQLLFLTCLDAATGTVSWSQSLCSVPQPIATDHHRLALVCSPSYAEGVLVVPTQAGLLVAADPLTGRLLWAASHDDGEPQHRQQMSAWPYSARRRHSHRGYMNLPIIHQGRVVYLPAHSECLHCLDLHTGQALWRVLREDLEPSSATEYVAAVADNAVLLVGRRRCRSFDLETGALRYHVRLGSTPAGRGVRLGTDYHIPLENGQIVSFDLSTGQARGATSPQNETLLGNLLAAGDLIVSMGRTEITAWPQAESELARIDAEQAAGRGTVETALDAAELELRLARPSRAQDRLATLKRTVLNRTMPPSSVNLRLRGLEREIIWNRLAVSRDDPKQVLEEIAGIATTPDERGRYLLELVLHGRRAEPGFLAGTAREIADRKLTSLIPLPDDPSRAVAVATLAAQLRREADRASAQSPVPLELTGPDPAAAIDSPDVTALRQAIELQSDASRAAEARVRLARLHSERGNRQEAELILLQCRQSGHSPVAGAATRMLVQLWEDRGLAHDASRMLAELATRFAHEPVGAGMTGKDYVDRFPRTRPAWEAYRQLAPPTWSGAGVRITEHREPRDNLHAIYNGNGIINLPVPRELPFDLFDKGRSGASGEFVLFDRFTGREAPETIVIPGRYHYPVHAPAGQLQHSYVGHFLPVGGPGTIHGVSFLERKLLWSVSPAGLQGARDNVRIGPAGPGYIACQHRQHLLLLDPADGGLLWRRDDLETMSGLMADPAGIIGDERVLVVFSGPETAARSYTVYDTATGEELRRGRLDISPKVRRAYGRKLFHATAGEARRLRVWDPLTDQFVWDVPADDFVEASPHEGTVPGTKLVAFVRDSDEAVFITKRGRIQVVDMVRGQIRFETALAPTHLENLCCLRAFCDGERYYFNLQRAQSPGGPPGAAAHIVHDANTLPLVHVQGEMWAVDRRTQQVLWIGSLGNRSIVHLPDFRLPVLISLFRVRKGDQTTLGVEVVDAYTGKLLASRDDLFSDRLLQVLYERQTGVIAFRAGKTEIRLEFPDELARLPGVEPLR